MAVLDWLRRHTTHYSKAPHGPVIASAMLATQSGIHNLRKTIKSSDWESLAWGYYDTIPELRYGTTWQSNAISRARLYVGKIDSDGQSDPPPVSSPIPTGVLSELFGGMAGQSEMLRRVAVHLNIPGETYILGVDTPLGRRWAVASSDELTVRGNDIYVVLDPGASPVLLTPSNSLIIRIWRPHARNSLLPDSPTRALLPTLRELTELSAHINATIESRLAGAGILVLPEELTSTNPGAGEGNPLHPDPVVADLVEAMVTPIQDRDSAAAVVPVVLKGPGEAAAALKHLTFSTPFDEAVQELREAAIKRVAVGLDMPFEILLGLGDTNHWSAWQIEESAVKLHVEPMLGLICDALTTQYLRPALTGLGVTNADEYVIWYDTSELILRPNRGPEARELYQLGLLSADATRRESGFSDDDAPTDDERLQRLITTIITQHPELTPQLLPNLGLPSSTPQLAPTLSAPAESTGDSTSRPEIPTQRTAVVAAAPAEQTNGEEKWQLAIAEMGALRALERAGAYLMRGAGRQYRGRLKHIPQWELHTILPTHTESVDHMLEGAYRTLEQALPDAPCICATVDRYVRELITRGEKHSRQRLTEQLLTAGCIRAHHA